MATKKVILKEIVDGVVGDSIYPQTSIEQVEGLENALAAAGSVSTISVNNGTPIQPVNKNINITVPEDLADLNDDSTHQTVTAAQKTEWSNKSTFSGNYNDLTNKPTIPSAVTESTVSGWGFTKNTGTYSKPNGGIPSTDFTSAVQTSLGKADTAIQSVTVGTTTTGAAGTNASVTNTGTATAPVLSFTIPQGAQGVKGDTVIMGNEDSYTLYNVTGDAVDGAMTQQAVTRELTELAGLPVDFTEVGISNMELQNGFSLGETQLVANNSRSYYRMYLSNFRNPIRKIRVTALGDYAARIAFVRSIYAQNSSTYVYIFPEGETSSHTVTQGTTEDFDVPVDTIMILVNNYSTADVFPAYIGIMQDVIDGGNLKGYVDAKTMDVNNINSTFFNQTILFTNKEVQEGASVSANVTLHGIVDGTNYIGYLGFYDSNCNLLTNIGKGSNTTTDTSVTGSINIPTGFSFCKVTTSVHDGLDVVLNVAGDANNGYVKTYTEHNLESDQSVTNCIIDNSTGTWVFNNYQTGRIWKVVEIPSTSKYLKIVSKANAAVYCAFLGSWQTPVNNAYPDYAEANATTHTYLGEYEVQIPSGAKFFVLQTHNTTIDVSPLYIGFDDGSTVLGNTLQYNEELEANGREIENVSCPNASVQVLATDDEDATEYDNANIGYFNVLKINDSMYYMYYSCIGANDSLGDQYQHLALAYSTDGVNFTRGIPEGVTSPVAGTNLIFQSKVIGVQVFKVQDNDYPYRMLASYNRADTRLYKSADGVNFSLVRVVFPYYCDNQVSCIVRGNIVKVYLRWRSDITGKSTSSKSYRWIGVFTMDIDGNIICPPTTFFGLNLYQASASILDERREVAFPTFYDFNVDKQYIHCYIIDGMNIKRLPFDTTNLIANDELSYYVAPGLVNIGSKMFMYLSCRTTSHNGFNSSNVTRVKRVEVVYDTQGTYWIG